jgi:4-hydroxysphinganine ceramide fatty acyl 2-hydroxylase
MASESKTEVMTIPARSKSEASDGAPISSEAALASANAKVDMHAPLVWQTLKLTKQEYLVWTHEPFLYTGSQKEARLFHTDWLEPLSKTEWYAIPAIWLPVGALLWKWWLASPDFSLAGSAVIVAVGVALWTVIEYAIHRGLFHMDDWIPDHPVVFLLHFLLHGIHHKIPMDHKRLVMPPVLFATLSSTVYSLLTPLALTVASWAAYHAVFGVVIACYVAYDMVHYSQHHVRFAPGSYMHAMKQYHMKHHFSGLQHQGFGITSKLWDAVFGTVLDIEAAKAAGRSGGGVGVGGGRGGGLEAIAKQD